MLFEVNRRRGIVLSTGALIVATLLASAVTIIPNPARAQTGCTELLVNGSYENGHDGWVEHSSLSYELIDPYYPHTGTKSAWLVANNAEEGWIAQTLPLPASTGGLTLRYWWSVYTEENPGGGFDILHVQLLRVDGTLLSTLATYSNDTAESWLWNPASADLSAYAGQTLQVRFYAQNDVNNPSSFFVDDVSIEACPSTATSTPTTGTPTATVTPGPSPTPTNTPHAKVYLPLILR